jgi:sugar transferase (PEP-CTERM/EpsH1 system associated)
MGKRKIKILHVIYSLGMGGAERVIVNYAKYFDKNRYELFVCALTEGGPYENDLNKAGVSYFILNKKKGIDLSVIPKISRILRSEQIDIVHLHDFSSIAWVTIPAIIFGVKRIIRTEHNVKRLNRGLMSNMKNTIKFILDFFQKQIVCVSEEVRKTHRKKIGFLSNKYLTIHNGIDKELFDIHLDREKYLREFNFDQKAILVCIVGRFFPQKAHDIFLYAIRYVLEKKNNLGILIVGDGPRKKELFELAKELGIYNQVTFTGNRSDIPQLLNLIDIFALSSAWEGFPMTILEAMACGKPAIVTDVGGNREAVIDGETGFIVPPGNPLAMSEAIIELIDKPELRRKMGIKGKERFLKNFTAQVMVQRTEMIYENLLKI